MIARVSEVSLSKNKKQLDQINAILLSVEGEGTYPYIKGSGYSTVEVQKANLITVSSWFDDVTHKGSEMKQMKQWHFVDYPIASEEVLKVKKEFHTEYNVTSALRDCIEALKNPTTTSFWVLNFIFRALIHFVGDIHTPVHCSERHELSGDSAEGDRGANNFKLTVNGYSNVNNLHKVWDSACLEYPDNNYNDEQTNALLSSVGSPVDWFGNLTELESRDPIVWAKQSYGVSRDYVYPKLPISQYGTMSPNDLYITKGAKIAKQQIALAAYRLNNLFQDYFNVPRKLMHMEIDNNLKFNSRIIGFLIVDIVLFIVSIVYIVLIFHVPSDKKERIVKAGRLNETLLQSLM